MNENVKILTKHMCLSAVYKYSILYFYEKYFLVQSWNEDEVYGYGFLTMIDLEKFVDRQIKTNNIKKKVVCFNIDDILKDDLRIIFPLD